jgi:hypothetical protein
MGQANDVEGRWRCDNSQNDRSPGNDGLRRVTKSTKIIGYLTSVAEGVPETTCLRGVLALRIRFDSLREALSAARVASASAADGMIRSVRIVWKHPQFGSGQPHDVTVTGCCVSPSRRWIALVRCSLMIVSTIAPRRRNLPAIESPLPLNEIAHNRAGFEGPSVEHLICYHRFYKGHDSNSGSVTKTIISPNCH